METAEQIEYDTYRVIVLNRSGTEILVVPAGDRFVLPCVAIPRWQRVAENLTNAVEAELGEQVVCLFPPDTAFPARHGNGIRYQVTLHWRTKGKPQVPTQRAPVSDLSQDSFTDQFDYAVMRHSLAECKAGERGRPAGPFARLGWFSELREWVEAVVEPRGWQVAANFRQFNASHSFSLIRFETNGPALWFKAVGEPNHREFPITCRLAQLFPNYLPPILATRPDWNGWLAQEVEGINLGETDEITLWEAAAKAIAELQIESINHSSPVLVSGARDLRVAALSDQVRPFMETMEHLMGQQSKVPPPALGREELLLLGDRIQDALDVLRDLAVPDALGHLDLNPGNIIVSQTQCALLDWAEAYVGSPFFSFQYLLQHFRRTISAGAEAEARLIAAYVEPWQQVVSRSVIAEALALAPLLAVFAYAAGNDAWADQERLADPSTAGDLRSLTRRMNCEATELNDRSSPCLR